MRRFELVIRCRDYSRPSGGHGTEDKGRQNRSCQEFVEESSKIVPLGAPLISGWLLAFNDFRYRFVRLETISGSARSACRQVEPNSSDSVH